MPDPSQKHVDDRLDAIRGRCEAIRSHAMAIARDSDNIHATSIRHKALLTAANAEDMEKDADERALKQQLAGEAMDEDIARERQAEIERLEIALMDERYEARKVGREML